MKLKNKKAIITGASKNIGSEIALKFASEGAEIIIHYNSDEKGAINTKEKVVAAGGKGFILQSNFSSVKSIASFAEEAVKLLDGVDILINNASEYDTSNILELNSEKFKSLLEVGVIAPMQLTQTISKYMINSNNNGSIINISSISSIKTYANRAAHASTKAALNALTKNSALDLGSHGIRVNAICPGPIPYDGGGEYFTDGIPLKRAGSPNDIANAALFLASDDATWITGHIMVVDGGICCK